MTEPEHPEPEPEDVDPSEAEIDAPPKRKRSGVVWDLEEMEHRQVDSIHEHHRAQRLGRGLKVPRWRGTRRNQ
jgi:hypothetical protein